MLDREKLLKLEVYSKRLKGSSAWIDDRVMALIAKQAALSDEAHPEEGLRDAFKAAMQDLQDIRDIVDEFGILIEKRSLEDYRSWQKEMNG